MTSLDYINDTPDRNIGIQYIRYTNEYIPKLQIHQRSLLNRTYSLDTIHQHKSSSLDQVWIIIKDHYYISIQNPTVTSDGA